MLSVLTRTRVSRKARSLCSIASQRSLKGVRFHRSQLRHTTHSLPLRASKASRRPMGSASMASLAPSDLRQ